MSANPLLAPWRGPFGGVPPFARVEVAHFVPALEAAIDAQRVEIAALVGNPEPPTFANTVESLEDAGRLFSRVMTVYGVWSSTMSTPAFQAVERAMSPRLAAFADEITQNAALFARLAAVHEASLVSASLDAEQQRIVARRHLDFVRAGARLAAAEKAELTALNQELAGLYTTFQQNVLADEEGHVTALPTDEDRTGLPASFGDAVPNTRSSVEPFLTHATRRDLRERVWRSFVGRGENGDAHDNRAVVAKILACRARRATLLGHASHAHWQLDATMAKTPERALGLMERLWVPAVARVREEVAAMRVLADHDVAPWDYRFLAEKVRKQQYDLDDNALMPYLQLDRLREAMFWVAGELHDLDFVAIAPGVIEVCHPDVSVFEVVVRATRAHVGLFYFDPFARPGKQSGAWMSSYRDQARFRGAVTPIVSNNLNLARAHDGAPTLVSWSDARTLFHELGHGLHGLLSDVRYPSLSGTSVPRDYVEFPSQLLEHWLATPEVLGRFAVHHETGASIPPELVTKLERSAQFNQGFATVEYLAAALVDMRLHLRAEAPTDPFAVARETLEALGMPDEIVMRHRTGHFAHLFSGDSYSAAYYAYLWADVLVADAFEAFEEADGPYDRAVADRYRTHVLSRGDTLDPDAGFLAFRGRPPQESALLRKRGFSSDVPRGPKRDCCRGSND